MVFLFHEDTDSLVSVMTMSVCVGLSGGRRLGPPAPASRSRSQQREVRAPVASRAGHNNIMWPGPHIPPLLHQSSGRRRGDVTNRCSAIIVSSYEKCKSAACYVLSDSLLAESSVSSIKWPPSHYSEHPWPDLWDGIPLEGRSWHSGALCGAEWSHVFICLIRCWPD